MTEFAPDAGFRKNRKLKAALLRHSAFSKAGFSERLFGLLFSGLVSPNLLGEIAVAAQAIATGVFAELQYVGLRRSGAAVAA